MTARDRADKNVSFSIAENYVDKLAINIFETRESMGVAAAAMVAGKIKELHAIQDFVNIIFASAPSQNEFLAALGRDGTIEWDRVNAFHMDEYIELPADDPRTFASYLEDKIFGRRNFRSINYINGNAASIGDECKRYAKMLTSYPADIVCLGIGENGHLAFNDPPVADFYDPSMVKMVKLDADCRQQQVNDGCFDQLGHVPAYALTLTIPALMAGKYIYAIVPGPSKAAAVYNTLNKEIIEKYPSTILRRHENAMLFLDRESSSLLMQG
ncbi:MAG TPA: 6-phosphogluconolactonase [Mucilaginibacter sp.]|jgi:glucosamine-6-phosphate deaminase|nr:6-phosphogluconolactonase [Mucilaginibacter sp.]